MKIYRAMACALGALAVAVCLGAVSATSAQGGGGLSVSPAHINFGRVPIGQCAGGAITVTNTGSRSVELYSATFAEHGNALDEVAPNGLRRPVIDLDPETFLPLEPGQDVMLGLEFCPASHGERHLWVDVTAPTGESFHASFNGFGY